MSIFNEPSLGQAIFVYQTDEAYPEQKFAPQCMLEHLGEALILAQLASFKCLMPSRVVYILPKKWHNLLRRFCLKHGLNIEIAEHRPITGLYLPANKLFDCSGPKLVEVPIKAYKPAAAELQIDGNWLKHCKDARQKEREISWYKTFAPDKIVSTMRGTNYLLLSPARGQQMSCNPWLHRAFLKQYKPKLAEPNARHIWSADLYAEVQGKFEERFKACTVPVKLAERARPVLAECAKVLSEHKDKQIYGHFDLNSLNVFVKCNANGTAEFDIIDPRGHFAGSCYGPLAYERSKVFYGVLIWPALSEYSCSTLAERNWHTMSLIQPQHLLGDMSELEIAWLKVHLLTVFGLWPKNPLRATIALQYGLELCEHIDDCAGL